MSYLIWALQSSELKIWIQYFFWGGGGGGGGGEGGNGARENELSNVNCVRQVLYANSLFSQVMKQ